MSISSQIESFSKLKIVVIGDVMVDAYYFGSVDRISPEAPVPVISVSKKDHRPGGAANVALNLISFGAKVLLCSVIGSDEEGRELMSLLNNEKIDTSGIFTDNLRPTTMKTRVISSNHHLLRIDHETTEYISSETENFLIDFVNKSIHTIDAIILEDYNKGLLTERLISEVISIANLAKLINELLDGNGYDILGMYDAGWNPGRYIPDTNKIRAELNVTQKVDLNEAIIRSASWYKGGM